MANFTPDQVADYLQTGFWQDQNLPPHAFALGPGNSLSVDLSGLSVDGQFFANAALDVWADVTGFTFNAVTQNADITFSNNSTGAFTTFLYSGNQTISAAINVSNAWIAADIGRLDSYSTHTFIHEVGHALGLGHAGNYNGSATFGVSNHYDNDSWQISAMSYFSQWENGSINADFAYVVTPQIADILAVQQIYNLSPAGLSTRPGDTSYFSNNNTGNQIYDIGQFAAALTMTIYDSGGVDTFDLSTFSTPQRIDLMPEAVSDIAGTLGNVTIARDTVIENAVGGGGDDFLSGNSANNILSGGAGDDVLLGLAGDDVLAGHAGSDVLTGGAGTDQADYSASGQGVRVSLAGGTGQFGDAAGDVLSGIEDVLGSMFADTLIGSGVANKLEGGDGDDYLYDFFAGDDFLFGDAGDDIIVGGIGADVLVGGAGVDTARYASSSGAVTINLGNGTGFGGEAEGDTFSTIENLFGSALGDTLIGDSGINNLHGYLGDDLILGGLGADIINGDVGFDTASYADSALAVDVGIYRIGTNGTAAGDTLSNIEAITGSDYADLLVGGGLPLVILSGGKGDDMLFDYGGTAELYGGEGSDTLIGSLGADHLDGGAGVDWARYANSIGAVTIDLLAGTGTGADADGDTLVNIENLVGSIFGDSLTGDAGNNRLEGGRGQDTLVGGAGTDVLLGGDDADLFAYFSTDWGVDYIVDFIVGQDLFDFTAVGLSFVDFIIVDTAAGMRMDYDNGSAVQSVALLGIDPQNIGVGDFLV